MADSFRLELADDKIVRVEIVSKVEELIEYALAEAYDNESTYGAPIYQKKGEEIPWESYLVCALQEFRLRVSRAAYEALEAELIRRWRP